jgi:surface antigen
MRKVLLIASLAGAMLSSAAAAAPISCVPYVRQVSTIDLRGDAWMWWQAAAGIYERGNTHRAGAVLVFKRYGRMVKGHVAVVAKVVGSREVLIDHANWAPARSRDRGSIAESVRVRDVSAGNDWSEVRVWHDDAQDFGAKAYPAYGFIYAPKTPTKAPRAHLVRTEDVTFPPTGLPQTKRPEPGQGRSTALLASPEMCQVAGPDTVAMLLEDLTGGRANLIPPTRVLWGEPTVSTTEMISER